MPLDFAKLRDASLFELLALFVCEFSRGVDALERIAPPIEETTPAAEAAPLDCPHPQELRVNLANTMGQEPMSKWQCGICQQKFNADGAPLVEV